MIHSYVISILRRNGRTKGATGWNLAIIDTHLHLIYRDRLSYPWLADVAALDRDFHL